MTSQPGQQTIAKHIWSNISRNKNNQIMKLGQLIEYNKIYFFKRYAENEVRILVPEPLFIFKKCLI